MGDGTALFHTAASMKPERFSSGNPVEHFVAVIVELASMKPERFSSGNYLALLTGQESD